MKGKIAKYVTVGTNDLERAKSFYDALFEDMELLALDQMKEAFFGPSPEMIQILLYLFLMMVKRPLWVMEV